MEEKIDVIMNEKEEAIYNQDFERAANLRDKEKEDRRKVFKKEVNRYDNKRIKRDE